MIHGVVVGLLRDDALVTGRAALQVGVEGYVVSAFTICFRFGDWDGNIDGRVLFVVCAPQRVGLVE